MWGLSTCAEFGGEAEVGVEGWRGAGVTRGGICGEGFAVGDAEEVGEGEVGAGVAVAEEGGLPGGARAPPRLTKRRTEWDSSSVMTPMLGIGAIEKESPSRSRWSRWSGRKGW